MLPAIFGENLFDEMFDDMMRPMHSMEKALYGKHARAIMKGLDKDEKKKGRYIRQERYAGQCSRSFYVGESVKPKDVHAKFEDGILKLSLPKAEKPKLPDHRTITIE